MGMTELSFCCIADRIPRDATAVVIAYSGGVDSQVLLHLCAMQSELHSKLSAIYIHHGLQAEADVWGEHCRAQCTVLEVAFQLIKVDASPKQGLSPEQAAREARYAALKTALPEGGVLLLAQHREDQMETLLLQLFRGAGVDGLAAMPEQVAFGRGRLIRPLLQIGKQAIVD